jgi:hypothetical protein
LPYDFSFKDDVVTGIGLKEFVETTMTAYAQTIFITDTPFDPEKVPSAIFETRWDTFGWHTARTGFRGPLARQALWFIYCCLT